MEDDLLYIQYQDAVKRGDIDNIRKFGEMYFSALNNGKISDDDKERLQNDILLCAAASKKNE